MQTSTLIVSAGFPDGNITLCDLRSGEVTTSWKGNFSHKGVCVLGSDSVAAAQADKQSVQFFSVPNRVQNRALVAENLSVLAATGDGQYLAGGAGSGTIYLWQLSSGHLLRAWPAHYKGVTALLFVGGASLLLSGGEDTMLHAWLLADLLDPSVDLDQAGPKPLHTWYDHTLQVTALAAGVGEAAAVVASASLDRTVKLRRIADGCQLRSHALPAAINDIVIDAGEETLYAAGADGVVYGISLGSDTCNVTGSANAATPLSRQTVRGRPDAQCDGSSGGYQAFVGHSRPVTCLVLASLDSGLGRSGTEAAQFGNGEVLISGSEDGTVRVWDLYSRQAVQVIATAGKVPVKSIRALPDLMTGSTQMCPTHTVSHSGASSFVPLSKYAGTSGGPRWQGPAVRVVEASEDLPQGGVLRLGAGVGVCRAHCYTTPSFALQLAGGLSGGDGPLLKAHTSEAAAVLKATESAEQAWKIAFSEYQ